MSAKLFGSVSFHILEKHIEGEDQERTLNELRRVLTQSGAIEEPFISELVTHIIADLPVDNIEALKGEDCKAVVVHSKWVFISSNCSTLLPFRVTPFETQECKLFAGVVACPTGISRNDRDKLHALLIYYGGELQTVLNGKVSHVIAIEPQGRKYQAALEHSIPVIRPEWVLDCIKCNKRLPESDYTIKKVSLDNKGLVVETISVTKAKALPSSMNNNAALVSEVTTNTDSQDIASNRDTIETLAESCSQDSNMAVDCSVILEESDKPLQNKYHILGRMSLEKSESPAASSIDKDVIAKTPQPCKPTDHVLEEEKGSNDGALLKGMVFVISDYPDVLDNDTISKWKDVIHKHGGKVLDEYQPIQCTHLLIQNTCDNEVYCQGNSNSFVCIASAYWLNDILSVQRMFPPCNPIHFPVAFKDPPEWTQGLSVTITNYVGEERELVRDMIRIVGIPYTGHLSRSTTHLICKRAEGRKYSKALEWNINIVNSLFISDIMLHGGSEPVVNEERYSKMEDENEFVQPCSELTRLMKPWQQFIGNYSLENKHLIDQESCCSCFALLSQPSSPALSSPNVDQEMSIARGIKLSESDPTHLNEDTPTVVMLTGFNPVMVKKSKSIFRSIGVKITNDPRKCTHLVAPRMARTIKFLCAISVSRYILSYEWIEECGKREKLVDEGSYALHDKDIEDSFDMSIALSLQRASERKLFNGIAVFSTKNVIPNFENLKLIIECAGGKLFTQSELHSVYGRKFERLATDGRLLIVVSCSSDVESGVCSEFYQRKIPVYNAEFILTGVLRQSLSYDQNQLTQ